MAPGDLQRFLDLNSACDIKNSFKVEPFFNGESLLHPEFYEMVESLVSNGWALGGLDTNLGIETDIVRLGRLPLTSLTVNIGGIDSKVHESVMGTPFWQVVQNLKDLARFSERNYQIFVKMNPVKENIEQLDQLSKFVGGIGENIKIKTQMTGFPVPADFTIEKAFQLAKLIYDASHPELFRFRLSPNTGEVRPKRTLCLYQTPCINFCGTLTSCAHDQLRHLNLGNVFKTSLSELLSRPEYLKAILDGKKRLLPICKGCN